MTDGLRERRRRARPGPRRRSTRADAVALACHVNPDGDALGSMLALHHVLRAAGQHERRVVPGAVRRRAALPRAARASTCSRRPTSSRREPEVMVTFDCGSLDRLGDLEPSAKAARRADRRRPPRLERAVRHDQRDRPDAAASGVLVRRLIDAARPPAEPRRRGLPLRRARVRHRPLPVRVDDAGGVRARRRARRRSTCRSRELSRARCSRSTGSRTCSCSPRRSARAELVPRAAFVWTAVTQDDLARHGVTIEEVEGLIDIVRRTARGRGRVRAQGGRRRHGDG